MKTSMYSLFILFFATTALFASQHTTSSKNQSAVRVMANERTQSSLRMSLAISEPVWEVVESGDVVLYRAHFDDSFNEPQPGEFDIPMLTNYVRLPAHGAVALEVGNVAFTTLTDVDYARWSGESDGAGTSQPLDGIEDAWFPSEVASLSDPGILHDFRVATVSISPVQVNPARREVRVVSSLDIEVCETGGEAMNELPNWPGQISQAFLSIYRDFLDWDESELDEYTLYRGSVQVVSHTSAFEFIQGWLDWKRQKGWALDLITEDDVEEFTAVNIKNVLQERYSQGPVPFDFIVIVGDGVGPFAIPPAGPPNNNYGVGDLEYTTLAGDDDLPDVALGRYSIENAVQAVGYSNKVLSYEKTPYLDETGWYLRGCVAAGAAVSGTSTILLGKYARHLMLDLGYTEVDTAWFNDGLGSVNARITNYLNAGVSFYSYRGWLGTGLGNYGINALNNAFKLPFVLDVTCGTGNWYQNTSYSESWMRGGTPTVPKGGIGAISGATSSQHTRYNNAISGGAIQSVLQAQNPHMGMAWVAAVLNLYKAFGADDYDWFYDEATWYELIGDPTLWIWTGLPEALEVDCPSTLPMGSNDITVTVLRDNLPVKDAWVTYYRSDEEEVVQVCALSDASGLAQLSIPVQTAGTGTISVTSQNCIPEIIDITLAAENRPSMLGFSVTDDGTLGTNGDGDRSAEAGETVGLLLQMKNFGDTDQTSVSVSLTSDDPGLESILGTTTIETLAAGNEATSTTPILVTIGMNTPHTWIAHLDAVVTSDQGEWSDGVALPISAPLFTTLALTPSAPLNPGETTDLEVTLLNIGANNLPAGHALLESLDGDLNILTSEADFENVDPQGEMVLGPFTVQVDPATQRGSTSDIRLLLISDAGRVDTVLTRVNLGERRVEDPIGPDRYGYLAYDNTDTSYSYAPEFHWVEIQPTHDHPDFSGIQLAQITDMAEEDDNVQLLDLPFPIQFYGETFVQMTIAGNGFISMGSQLDMNNARNWPMPSPLGPNYMIAPFWDDRRVEVGSGVYFFYDEDGDRLIIEWSGVTDFYGESPCSFEVIFYDRVGEHISPTGDNDILFQYQQVEPSLGAYDGIRYYTTGIENGDQTDGIQCAYWNRMMPGMAQIEAGRAILFTTRGTWRFLPGVVQGQVTDQIDGSALGEVTVLATRVEDGIVRANDLTNEMGGYLFEVPSGEYTFTFQHPLYDQLIVGPLEVTVSETLSVDAAMTPAAGGLIDRDGPLPTMFSIESIRPNPFNPSTTLRIGVPRTGRLTVDVIDVMGRRVKQLIAGTVPPGYHNLSINGSHLASGVYFVRANMQGENIQVKKIVLLK